MARRRRGRVRRHLAVGAAAAALGRPAADARVRAADAARERRREAHHHGRAGGRRRRRRRRGGVRVEVSRRVRRAGRRARAGGGRGAAGADRRGLPVRLVGVNAVGLADATLKGQRVQQADRVLRDGRSRRRTASELQAIVPL